MISGSKFWRFDPSQKPPVKSTYPKPLSNWEGIPDNLDAALQYTNGYTYFFKRGQYYRFNDRTFMVIPIVLYLCAT
jgi:matrix metalloproteinase-14 (membrane-inserted)